MVIGILGGVASGKSFVLSVFAKLGVPVLSADSVYHELILPQRPLWKRVVGEWGVKILGEDGQIDRKELGRIVFSSKKELEKLNSITHPAIVDALKKKLNELSAAVVAVEAPVLIESGRGGFADQILVVDLPCELQLGRLMARGGLTRQQALSRISSQVTREERLRLADKIIDNSRTFEETEAQIADYLKEINNRL